MISCLMHLYHHGDFRVIWISRCMHTVAIMFYLPNPFYVSEDALVDFQMVLTKALPTSGCWVCLVFIALYQFIDSSYLCVFVSLFAMGAAAYWSPLFVPSGVSSVNFAAHHCLASFWKAESLLSKSYKLKCLCRMLLRWTHFRAAMTPAEMQLLLRQS